MMWLVEVIHAYVKTYKDFETTVADLTSSTERSKFISAFH